MRIIVIASGSNGNATYMNLDGIEYLIDCGISYKALKERLEEYDINIETIGNVILTHEHIDHVKGLQMLVKKNPNIQIFSTKGTIQGLKADVRLFLTGANINYIKQLDEYQFLNHKIVFLRTHHDAKEPIGVMVLENGKKFVYITDTGYFEEKYIDDIKNPDLLVLESNYDVEVLFASNRPYELKERINSNYGHLSNYDSAIIASKVIGANTKDVVLAHVSADCNYYSIPEMIIKYHQDIYKKIGLDIGNISFVVGNRDGVTKEFIL